MSNVELRQIIYDYVSKINRVLGSNWPIVYIHRNITRKDTIGTETDFFSELLTEDGINKLGNIGIFEGVITRAASRHVPFTGKNKHFIYWWAENTPEGYKSCDINKLLELQQEKQKDWAQLSAKGIRVALDRIKEELNITNFGPGIENVFIYGLTGYATNEERMDGTTNRGAPSNIYGHAQIVYRDEIEDIKHEKLSVRVRAKQIGAVDDLVARIIGDHIANWLSDILIDRNREKEHGNQDLYQEQNLTENNIGNISFEENYDISQNKISVYEGIKFSYKGTETLEKAFVDLLSAQSLFSDIYLIVRNLNYEYYKYIGDNEAVQRFIKDTRDLLLEDFPKEMVDGILYLIQYFKPTRGQLEKLLVESEGCSANRDELEKLKDNYIYLEGELSNPDKKQAFIKEYADRKGIDLESAEIMAEYLYDMVRNPKDNDAWRQIEFIFTKYFSSSYKINIVEENGEIKVKSFTISTKFATQQGGAEILLGTALSRAEG